MATKIYLPSSGSPAVTPSSWIFTNQGASAVTYAGVISKISSAFTNVDEGTGTTNPYTEAVLRYVIGPLAAQTISGTVRMVMRVSESNAGANANLRMACKIIQSSGADRATLLGETGSDSATSPYEMTTTLSSKRCWTASETEPLSLSSQSASQGDYLVIEIGHRSATATNRTIRYNIGDNNANDLTYGDDETNVYCGWVEFSANISWYTPIQYWSGSGTLSAAGALVKEIRRSFTGGLSIAGLLTKEAEFYRSFTGALSIDGTLSSLKIVKKALDGTLTMAGALLKETRRSFAGGLSTAGALLRKTSRSFTGTLSSAGALIKQTSRSFTGSLSIAGALSASKVVLKSLTGTLTTAGTLIRQTRRSFTGALSSAGALSRIVSFHRSLTGTLTIAGALSKIASLHRSFTGTLTISGALATVSSFHRSLTGSLSISGTIIKKIGKNLSGLLTTLGNLIAEKIAPTGQVPGTVDILDSQSQIVTLMDTISAHTISIIDATVYTVEIGDAHAEPI